MINVGQNKFKVGDNIKCKKPIECFEREYKIGEIFEVTKIKFGDGWPYSIRGMTPESGWRKEFIENHFDLYIETLDERE